MAFIAVTYTFVNASTADATQVNQNFTDIVNGASDGTKNFNISALTCGGSVTLNNAITLGQSSSNALTVNASLASSFPIQTNTTYDFGSATLGLRSVYIGGSSTFTTRILGGTQSGSLSLTLPPTAGSSRFGMLTDGAGVTGWAQLMGGTGARNYGLSTSVNTNALTITLLGGDGSALSSTNVADIMFRSATATTGNPSLISVTSNVTLTIPSGTTIGTSNGVATHLYVYALNNAGTVELAVSCAGYFDEGSIATSTSISGGGSATTLYSTNGRSNVAIRRLGRIYISEATAGTWASNATEVSTRPITPRKLVLISSASGTSDGTSNSTSYATFSNAPTLTLTPQCSGPWKILGTFMVRGASGGGNNYGFKIDATAGSPTVLARQDSPVSQFSNDYVCCCPYLIVYLTAGTSYTFDIYGKVPLGQGPITLRNSFTDAGHYLIAEQL